MLIGHIETPRLRIRSFQRDDWQAVYDYTCDPAVMAYIPEGPFTTEQARAFVADNTGEQARAFAVLLKADDTLKAFFSSSASDTASSCPGHIAK
jgi:[ribosomal protein S5]-alanine N-acetyltransferase